MASERTWEKADSLETKDGKEIAMNLSIRIKIIGILALQMIAMALMGWQGIAGMGELNTRIQAIYEQQFVPSRMMARANSDLIAWKRAILNHLLAENAGKMEADEQNVDRHQIAVIHDLEALLAMTTLSGEESRALKTILEEFSRAISVGKPLLKVSREGRTEDAQTILDEDLRPIVDAIEEEMAAFLNLQENQLLEARKTASDQYRQDLQRILLVFGIVFFVSLLLSLLMSETILKSVRRLLKGAREFGRGNLEYRVEVKSRDEIQELAEALNSMAAKRKSAEDQLRNSNEKLKLFAYSVIHDLKSPAIGIHGLTALLHKRCQGVLDPQGEKICDQILKASEQVVALVEKVNTYIATKEMPLKIEPINSFEIFQMIGEEFAIQLNIRQVRCSWPETVPLVKADRVSLVRVFRNLVDNALKYGGEQLSEIRIGYEESSDFHVFSVGDNGVGVKTEDPEELFALFQRHETSKGVDGTGLGLAIVKEIAEKHQGEVWAEPRAQGGVNFFVTIAKDL
jgi:signal transduction histidine kinase